MIDTHASRQCLNGQLTQIGVLGLALLLSWGLLADCRHIPPAAARLVDRAARSVRWPVPGERRADDGERRGRRRGSGGQTTAAGGRRRESGGQTTGSGGQTTGAAGQTTGSGGRTASQRRADDRDWRTVGGKRWADDGEWRADGGKWWSNGKQRRADDRDWRTVGGKWWADDRDWRTVGGKWWSTAGSGGQTSASGGLSSTGGKSTGTGGPAQAEAVEGGGASGAGVTINGKFVPKDKAVVFIHFGTRTCAGQRPRRQPDLLFLRYRGRTLELQGQLHPCQEPTAPQADTPLRGRMGI